MVGNGVALGAGVRVGRSAGVGDMPATVVSTIAVPASGVKIDPNPASKVGVGGVRVVAPTGVEVAILPAWDTRTTCAVPDGVVGVGPGSRPHEIETADSARSVMTRTREGMV